MPSSGIKRKRDEIENMPITVSVFEIPVPEDFILRYYMRGMDDPDWNEAFSMFDRLQKIGLVEWDADWTHRDVIVMRPMILIREVIYEIPEQPGPGYPDMDKDDLEISPLAFLIELLNAGYDITDPRVQRTACEISGFAEWIVKYGTGINFDDEIAEYFRENYFQ